MTTADDLSKPQPIKPGWWDEALAKHESKRCTAHKKNGERCRKFAIYGTNVCRVHGGAAGQVRRKAALRLAMATDAMAKHLLGLAETAASEGVQLAATNSALDRGGLAAKTLIDVELNVKPFELVFDAIAAGPRDPEDTDALAIESESAASESESEDDEIVGELDDDVIEDDLLLPSQRELVADDSAGADVLDVEIEAGYTDDSAGTATPVQDQSQPDERTAPALGPLGMNGPVGSGMLSLQDANEAVAEMRAREAARLRNLRRR